MGAASFNRSYTRNERSSWKVSIDDIRERNYNLDIKNPFQAEEEIHDPDELLARYEQQQAEIQALRDELKTILGDALAPKDEPEQERRSA